MGLVPITFLRTLSRRWLQHCRSLVRLLTFLGGRTIVCTSQIVSPLGPPASSGKFGLIGGTSMAERNPYIPANVVAGSIKVSCIQHANVETTDVARSQEWYKKVFDVEWTEEHPRYL